ncbi:uncharacterized protein VTP21DRAFT_8692 [Calcarisporiella thermophila]|uniref:uncharacterized protein n=1 Tax=Calcarisporiella thermophila TaxID=911321 RepID=UPI0037446450
MISTKLFISRSSIHLRPLASSHSLRTFATHPGSTAPSPQVADNPSEPTRTEKKRSRYRLSPVNIPSSPEFGSNQNLPLDEDFKQQLRAVVQSFNAPVRYAFAYGSGVFRQRGYDTKKKPMVDFILAVTHPEHWHYINIQQNPHHYSFLRWFGSGAVSFLQDKVGAHVYFNPYVEVNGLLIKYGVVSVDRLCKDLLDWETLYLAGRMHKPVKILRDDARVRLANQVNLTSALRTALLMLPGQFTEEELFMTISGFSYTGDFRMRVGENPHKVRNIVVEQMENFHRLYSPLIEDLPNVAYMREGVIQQDENPRVRGLMVRKLPRILHAHVKHQYRSHSLSKGERWSDDEYELGQLIVRSPVLKQFIAEGLNTIVKGPALTQSLKGVLTAGPTRTTRYVYDKLSKWWSASS